MKIPADPLQRQQLYEDLIRKCTFSRSDREAAYRACRSYYLFGCAEGLRVAYNKIQPTVELLRSFIYSAETTRFTMHLGATLTNAERTAELQKGRRLAEEVNEQWHESDTDLIVADAVTWSLVNGCTIVKQLWKGGSQPYLVDPENFGVYREDIASLERQEAVVECYTISKAELERQLDEIDHPRRSEIIATVSANAAPQGTEGGFPEGVQRLVISQTTPNMIGAANASPGMGDAYQYRPMVDAELVGMFELYVWDDDLQDYRIVTIAEGGVIIFDRKNFGIPKMLPYTKYCPKPLPFYFWGQSFVASLMMLQDWRTERMEQIKKLLSMAVKPPKSAIGIPGITDEKMAALFRAGGSFSSPTPGGDIKEFAPKVPENVFAEIQQIDAMFEDMAGVSHVMQGKGESGVRAKGHADLLARLSSARPKQMALVIEDALERQATMSLRLLQQHSDQEFQTEAEPALTFIARQFTNDFVVKVDAHSSSAIFVEDKKADAEVLLKAGAIDRTTFLEMFDPPGVQELKARLKVREAQEQKAAEQKMQLEMMMHGKGKGQGEANA